MKRRKFIAVSGGVVTATFAGCVNPPTSNSSTDSQYTASSEEQSESTPLVHDMEILHDNIQTSDKPIRIEVTITNESEDTVQYGERRQALFWFVRSNGFYLVPENESSGSYAFDDDLGFWVSETPFEMTYDYQVGELEPGESHVETLALLASTDDELPKEIPDELTFETDYRLYDDGPSEDSDSVEWEFTLSLSEHKDESTYTVETASQLDEVPIQYTVTAEQNNLQHLSDPFTIEVSITNKSDEIIEYGERRRALFWSALDDEDEVFILLPKERAESLATFTEETDVWVAEEGLLTTADYQTDELAPGETHTESLILLVQHNEDIPQELPDELTFSTSLMISEKNKHDTEKETVDWSFSIEETSEIE